MLSAPFLLIGSDVQVNFYLVFIKKKKNAVPVKGHEDVLECCEQSKQIMEMDMEM